MRCGKVLRMTNTDQLYVKVRVGHTGRDGLVP